MKNANFDFGTRMAMSFIVAASASSALSVAGLLLYIAVCITCVSTGTTNANRNPPQYSTIAIRRNASRKWKMETQVHYYFVNLLLCDLILAVGMSYVQGLTCS